ncbi:MAG TPA: hypothetical protein VFG04_27395 [Planctomycetaceae bacterium]|jgi:hypothetical protein|nr:hypothetical protein [Planctomycetaceae bacterium]
MTAATRELKSQRPIVCKVCQTAGPRGWLLICLGLAIVMPGCGRLKSKSAAPAATADAEKKAEEPDPTEKPPIKVEKKPVEVKAPAPVVRHVPSDLSKWQLADLQSALSAQDLRFVGAVMLFSVQSLNGKKQAQDLKGLLESAGRMKDDASISLPLAPAPAFGPMTAAKPVVPGAAADPSQPAAPSGRKKKPGRLAGGGFGGGLK